MQPARIRQGPIDGLGEACVGPDFGVEILGKVNRLVRDVDQVAIEFEEESVRVASIEVVIRSADLVVVLGALGGVLDIPQPGDVRLLQPLLAKFVGLGVLVPCSLQVTEELSMHVGVRILVQPQLVVFKERIPLCPPAVYPRASSTFVKVDALRHRRMILRNRACNAWQT